MSSLVLVWSLIGALIGWAAAERRGFSVPAGVVAGRRVTPRQGRQQTFDHGPAAVPPLGCLEY
jgi:hypothetical protein